jgi:hypothetical protein
MLGISDLDLLDILRKRGNKIPIIIFDISGQETPMRNETISFNPAFFGSILRGDRPRAQIPELVDMIIKAAST